MKTVVKIKLTTISDVQKFNETCRKLPCDISLISGRYIVDAKSIMGIYSLNLSSPIEMEIDGTEEDYDLSEIMKFEVN